MGERSNCVKESVCKNVLVPEDKLSSQNYQNNNKIEISLSGLLQPEEEL